MRTKFLFIGVLTLLLVLSCSTDNTTLSKEEQSFDLSKLDLSDLDLTFSWKETIKKEKFASNLNETQKREHIVNEVSKLNNQIEQIFKKDKNVELVEYSITVSNTEFSFDMIDLKNKSKSKLAKRGAPVSPYEGSFSCPEGQKLVDTCWSKDCVGKAIENSLKDIKSGETVRFTVHHGGPLGGVAVCADSNYDEK